MFLWNNCGKENEMWVQKVHQWTTAVGADNNLASLYSAPQPVCCHACQSVCSQQSCLVSDSTMLVVWTWRSSLCLSRQAGDQRWLRTASSALHLLHSLYGPFSKVYGIGRCSKVAAATGGSLSSQSASLLCSNARWSLFRWPMSCGGTRRKRANRGLGRPRLERFSSSTEVGGASDVLAKLRHGFSCWLMSLSSQMSTLCLLFARKSSMKDSLMTYSESNVVRMSMRPILMLQSAL